MSVIKIFTDKQGNQIIFQRPNLPLVVWFITMLLAKVLPDERIGSILHLISFGALFTWCWLEISQGDSMFRKLLGGTIIVLAVVSRV